MSEDRQPDVPDQPAGTAPETPTARPEPPEPAEVDLAAVEAILFATDSALSAAKIAEVAALDGGRRAAKQAIERLNERYEQMGCAFRIEPLAGGYQMLTLPEYNDILARLLKVRSDSKLSQAAMEALAIVAYKQPILRANIEAIRGVSSGEVVRGLMDKGLVKIVGRAEEIGRPMLYGTTRKFLEVFGLSSLKDLPEVEELASGATAAPPKRDADEDEADEEQAAAELRTEAEAGPADGSARRAEDETVEDSATAAPVDQDVAGV